MEKKKRRKKKGGEKEGEKKEREGGVKGKEGGVGEKKGSGGGAETQRRRAGVENEKVKEELRTLAHEQEGAPADSRSRIEEKREIEKRARAIAGLWKKFNFLKKKNFFQNQKKKKKKKKKSTLR
eukprot:TRINITY_DN14652_c0_g1_i1.p1 TRINITY_DN14652_c0_g1~~TRINITY_DN14652_c0_g1_i1.p1  ORF type:complete len:124 (+),score=37.75 TRINITY_DN14652_c0_g1_i1:171-542(+)